MVTTRQTVINIQNNEKDIISSKAAFRRNK